MTEGWTQMDSESWRIIYKCYYDEKQGWAEVKRFAEEHGYEEKGPWDQVKSSVVSLAYYVKGEYFFHLVRYQDILCVYGFVDFDFPYPFAIVESTSKSGLKRCRARIDELKFESQSLEGREGKRFHVLKGIKIKVECPECEDVENTYYIQLVQFIGSLYLIFWANENIHIHTSKIERLDEEIKNDYNYRLPERFNEEFLYKLSKHMDLAGRALMKIEQYYGTIGFHLKNLKMLMERLNITVNENGKFDLWEIETRPLLEAEHRLKLTKTVWSRLLTLRDVANGMANIRMQKSSHSLHFASWAMEFFVIFVYVFELWERVNPVGYETAPGILRSLVPPSVALGIVLITEGFVRRRSEEEKSFLYLGTGLILLFFGFLIILGFPQLFGGANGG